MTAARSIGPYDIVRLLDAGGMGKVYLAREREGVAKGRLVVVKTIRAEYERTPEHVESFHREARVLAHMRHPNIVQLHDAGRVGHRLYMAMEYLEGLDVAKVLKLMSARGERIPPEVAVHIGREIALALEAAHGYEIEPGKPGGLVHRDLSPHNVFLLYGGGVKLLDFGLARAYGEDGTTRTGMVKGKFRYLAPEQARGEALDRRVDIFALGLVLHEMLAGTRAYEQHGDIDVLRAAMEGDFPRLSKLGLGLPEPLVTVVEKALAADREERYATALELAEDLRLAAAESHLLGDPLELRRFMGHVRELTAETPPPLHADVEDDDEFDEPRPSVSYLRPSDVVSIEQAALPRTIPPMPPPRSRREPARTWLAGALAAVGVAALVGAIVIVKGAQRPAASEPPQPSAPPSLVATEAPAPASASAAPADSVAPASSPAAGPAAPAPTNANLAPTGPAGKRPSDRKLVKPKRGVGTGVVADYP